MGRDGSENRVAGEDGGRLGEMPEMAAILRDAEVYARVGCGELEQGAVRLVRGATGIHCPRFHAFDCKSSSEQPVEQEVVWPDGSTR